MKKQKQFRTGMDERLNQDQLHKPAHTSTLSIKQVGSDTSWFHLYEDGIITAQVQFTSDGYKADAQAQRIVKAVNAHEGLLSVAKMHHSYDDAGHREKMPECAACLIIAQAEGK